MVVDPRVYNLYSTSMKGTAFRQHRMKLRMTQKELAEALGVAPNTVARYERGESGIPEPVVRLILLLPPKRKA